jgi:hypothetical protein
MLKCIILIRQVAKATYPGKHVIYECKIFLVKFQFDSEDKHIAVKVNKCIEILQNISSEYFVVDVNFSTLNLTVDCELVKSSNS